MVVVCGFLVIFWAQILDFACDKVRIVDLSDCQKYFVLFVFVVCVVLLFLHHGQGSLNVTQSREIVMHHGQ